MDEFELDPTPAFNLNPPFPPASLLVRYSIFSGFIPVPRLRHRAMANPSILARALPEWRPADHNALVDSFEFPADFTIGLAGHGRSFRTVTRSN